MCLCSTCPPWIPTKHKEFVDIDVVRKGTYFCTWSSCYTSSATAHHLLLWPAHCLQEPDFLCSALPKQFQYPTGELKYTIWCLWQFKLGQICNPDWKAHTAMKAKEEKKQNSFLLSRKMQLCPVLTSILFILQYVFQLAAPNKTHYMLKNVIHSIHKKFSFPTSLQYFSSHISFSRDIPFSKYLSSLAVI